MNRSKCGKDILVKNITAVNMFCYLCMVKIRLYMLLQKYFDFILNTPNNSRYWGPSLYYSISSFFFPRKVF